MPSERTTSRRVPQRSVVDLFCGAGGLSLGLLRAGFVPRAAFDRDEAAIRTYRHNIGPDARVGDVAALSATDVLGSTADDLDLLAGGPPCQGFSTQKRGAHRGDVRNRLVLEHLRLIRQIRARAFLLENVAMLAKKRGAHLVDRYAELADYTMTGHLYCAADYGLAQTRRRFILVGIRNDQAGTFAVPSPTTLAGAWTTVGEAIGDLPEPPEDGSEHPAWPNHRRSMPSSANIERIAHVPQGGGWRDIPYELRLPCHQRVAASSGSWPDVYGRLCWDGQCPTVTAGFDSFTRGRYAHPTQDRALTPREAARLQGFPDDFVFLGNRSQVRHQIGNAVPVPLATTIGLAIMAALGGL